MEIEEIKDFAALQNFINSKEGRCQISRKLLQEMVMKFEQEGYGNQRLLNSISDTQGAIQYYEERIE